MKKLIDKYESLHKTAFICQIGAFRDLLHFHNHEMSFPFCFGISGALSFAYGPAQLERLIAPDYYLPPYMASPIVPLSFAVNNLCRVTNVWSKSGRTMNPAKLMEIIKTNVNEDRPVIVEVESMQYFLMLGIPSFSVQKNGVRFAIGGHVVPVIGYDDEKGTLIIVEAFVRNSLEVSIQKFLECCQVEGCYVSPEGEWAVFYVPPKLPPIKSMVFQGIRHTVHQMLYSYRSIPNYYFGFKGLEKFFEDIIHWPQLMESDQLQISLGLFYNFERMDLLRGCFRKLYSVFLLEAADSLQNAQLKTAAELYDELGKLWSEFAKLILIGINDTDKGIFNNESTTTDLMAEIIKLERDAILFLDDTIKNW